MVTDASHFQYLCPSGTVRRCGAVRKPEAGDKWTSPGPGLTVEAGAPTLASDVIVIVGPNPGELSRD